MTAMEMTLREWDVLVELCKDGAGNRQIARRLFITEDTAKVHIKALLRKSGLRTRTELAVAVLRKEVALAILIPRRHCDRPAAGT